MKKVLIFGGSGLVGSKFIDLYKSDFEITAPTAQQVDILNLDQVKKIISDSKPNSIINFAAYTNVEEAEKQTDDKNGICYQINCVGAQNVAKAAFENKNHLIHISTEYVFDGKKEIAPYVEEDVPGAINWYGKTKQIAEELVSETGGKNVIARICMPFSSYYELKKDVARFFLDQLKNNKEIKAIADQRITPTLVNDIAVGLKTLIDNDSTGLYHISSRDSVTPLEFAKTIAEVFDLNYDLISDISFDEYNQTKSAKLLKYSWLNPSKFEKEFGENILHTVEEGLTIFKQEIDSKGKN